MAEKPPSDNFFRAILLGPLLAAAAAKAVELDRCPKCGEKMEHHCGMGACVDLCPRCDRL